MTTTATKIITWAANESNGHGAHIEALTHALNSSEIDSETRGIVEAKRSEWAAEHQARFE